MIQTRKDYVYYKKCDLLARGYTPTRFGNVPIKKRLGAIGVLTPWKYQMKLRRAEYYLNCGPKWSRCTIGEFMKLLARQYGSRCGFSIPVNSFGPGLCVYYIGTIVVNGHVKAGSNIRIYPGVNIGTLSKYGPEHKMNVPSLGNNVYIGPGAKLWGEIQIGNDVAIGANATISKNIPNHVTVVGANKIINDSGSIDMILYGDSMCSPYKDKRP